jgi:hypothetical protein
MKNRIKKGQKALSTLVKEKQKQSDTLEKIAWLKELANDHKRIPADLSKFTLSYLAQYENKPLKLKKIAYNTFKKHVNLSQSTTGISWCELSTMLTSLSKTKCTADRKRSKSETISHYKLELSKRNKVIENITKDYLDLRNTYNNLVKQLDKNEIARQAIRQHKKTISLVSAWGKKKS